MRNRVALRKESVDRNMSSLCVLPGCFLSLSARRAWIEMRFRQRKVVKFVSLSARRAWIEILPALKLIACHNGRSPQGERG